MLLVGIVHRPHGREGEVSVEAVTSFPERFAGGLTLSWRRAGAERQLVLASARPHGGRLLLRFEGVGDREAARDLAGGELLVPDDAAVKPPEGFYYSHEVAGWRCEDPSGRPLGTAAGLEDTPAGPLLTVDTPDRPGVLIPFVAGIVVAVDRVEKRIVLDPPDGIWDL